MLPPPPLKLLGWGGGGGRGGTRDIAFSGILVDLHLTVQRRSITSFGITACGRAKICIPHSQVTSSVFLFFFAK